MRPWVADRRRAVGRAAAVAVLVFAGEAVAQCAMCGSATPYAGSSPGRAYATFAVAALVLLVPVFGMLGTLAAYLWKHRD